MIRVLMICAVLLVTVSPSVQAGSGTLTNCTYTDLLNLINSGGTIQFGCSGQIDFPSEIVITADTTLDASGQNVTLMATSSRLFWVTPGVTLTVRGLTLTATPGYGIEGGAVYNEGTLRLEQATIFDSFAEWGGGIYNEGGTVSIHNSTLDSNDAEDGGGLNNNGGQVDIVNSTLSNNHCVGFGGAISNGGTARITNSTFTHNLCVFAGGGAIHNGGTMDVTNTSFANNGAEGGSINNTGTLSMTNCSMFQDWAIGVAVIRNAGTVTITNCTITIDQVETSVGIIYYQEAGSSTFRNTTIIGGPDRENCAIRGGTIDAKGNNQSSDNTCPDFRPLKK